MNVSSGIRLAGFNPHAPAGPFLPIVLLEENVSLSLGQRSSLRQTAVPLFLSSLAPSLHLQPHTFFPGHSTARTPSWFSSVPTRNPSGRLLGLCYLDLTPSAAAPAQLPQPTPTHRVSATLELREELPGGWGWGVPRARGRDVRPRPPPSS